MGKQALYLVQSSTMNGEPKNILGLFSSMKTALQVVSAVEEGSDDRCEVIRLTVDGGKPSGDDTMLVSG